MLRTLKSSSIKKTLVFTVIFVLIGVIPAGFFVSDVEGSLFHAEDLTGLPADEIKDQFISCELTAASASFATVTTTYSDGSEVLSYGYYVIPVGEKSYMAVKIPASRFEEMDALVEETGGFSGSAKDTVSHPYKIRGKINSLTAEEEEVLDTFFSDSGFSDSEIHRTVLKCILEEGEGSYGPIILSYVLFAAGVLLFLAGLIPFLSACLGGCQNKVRKALRKYGAAPEEVDEDFSHAALFGEIRFGEKYWYLMKNRRQQIIASSQIVWVYRQTKAVRGGGMGFKRQGLVIYESGGKKPSVINLKQDQMPDILKFCHETYPHIVVGYSKERETAFKEHPDEFPEKAGHAVK